MNCVISFRDEIHQKLEQTQRCESLRLSGQNRVRHQLCDH
jgi:hypothetical protein